MTRLLKFGLGHGFDRLPASVVERSKMAVLDTLGAAMAGYDGEAVPQIVSLATDWGGKPEATVLASGRKLPLPLAVLANSTTARALDLDDAHEQNTCHVNASTVPVALALSEARGPISGAEFLSAVAVGGEMICRTSAAPRISFSETGQSLSYQCSYFGAALVAARLMRLPLEQAGHAMGIAYARVAGNQQGFLTGAMTVRLMQGVASEGGVLAALMAERGLTGSSNVLEGRFGYYPVFHRGLYEPSDLTAGLGQHWRMEEVSIKAVYPCCKYIHGPIDAVISALNDAALAPEDVAEIRVKVSNKEVYDLVCSPPERKWFPASVTDRQFSLPFMVAWAAVYRSVGFAPLSDQSLTDARVRSMLERVKVDSATAEQGTARGTFPMPGVVVVTDRAGRQTHRTVEFVKGHPRNAMNYSNVAAKFSECAAYGRPGWRGADQVIDLVSRLDALEDASVLARLCARVPQRMREDVRDGLASSHAA